MRLKYLAGSMLLLPSISYGVVTWNGSLGVEKSYTDNARLTEADERSDSANSLNAALTVSVVESRLLLNANYNYEKEDWQHDTFDTNSSVQGVLQATAILVPARLNWLLHHERSLTRTESQLPNTPDNREERTIVSTGPTLTQRINDRSRLEFSSLYSEVDLEESSRNDTSRVSNAVSWIHMLSPTSNLSATVSRENAMFEEVKTANYSRESAYLELSGSKSLFDYSVALGINKLNPREGDDQSGKFVNLSLSRAYQNSSISMALSKELTDSIFGSGQVDSAPGSTPIDSLTSLSTIEIIERDTASIAYTNNVIPDLLQLGFVLSYEKDKSEERGGIDQEGITALFNGSYALNQRMSLVGEIEWGEDTFNDVDPVREDELKRLMLGLNYRIGERINGAFEVQQRELVSDLDGADYEEFSSFIRVEYLFGI